jgi:hypothetical protein
MELGVHRLRLMQAAGTDRNAGNFFEGLAANAAIVGEKERNKAAKDPLRDAENNIRQDLPASSTR